MDAVKNSVGICGRPDAEVDTGRLMHRRNGMDEGIAKESGQNRDTES